MADFAKNNIQKDLFEYIKNTVVTHINLAYDISTLLDISIDAAYRRIRGEKQLSLNELIKISRYYNLSIDNIINYKSQANDVRFYYIPLLQNFQANYLTHLTQFKDQLSDMAKQEKKKLYFSASDIPVFYLFKYPNLKSFKSYTWLQQWGGSVTKYKKDDFLDEKHLQLYQDIYSLYKEIDSDEIWTIETMDSYLKLINYYSEIDCFENPQDAIELCDDLLKLTQDIKGIGEMKYKTSMQNLGRKQLFLSEINLDNNFVYGDTSNYKITFITLFSLNTIKTTHEMFCNGTKKWFNSAINKSILISGFSQKQFLIFIKELNRKIEKTKRNLTTLMSIKTD